MNGVHINYIEIDVVLGFELIILKKSIFLNWIDRNRIDRRAEGKFDS